MKKNILSLLKNNILILDGATGTELQKLGMPTGVNPEKWCLLHPEILKTVHLNYLAAGSNIIYTSTFGANRLKLSQYKIKDVYTINKNLAKIARCAAGSKALVAGDIGPTGEFITPFGQLKFDDAVHIFKEQAKGLLSGGVDLFVIETMMDIQEARAALIAVRELSKKFTIVTMTYEAQGLTLNGNTPESSLITLQSLGADAVGCNCSTGPQDMLKFIRLMKPLATVPLAAKPNAGIPKLINNNTFFDMDPREFALFGKKLASSGVNLLGGCCGTTPGHIQALKKAVSNLKPIQIQRKSIAALSSARSSVIFKTNNKVIIIGESINPTGKKTFQKELLSGRMTQLNQLATSQKDHGAHILDVNVGMPGIDEKITLLKAIETLSVNISVPLCIDSSRIDAIEEALKIYPGRALINSISGEKNKTRRLLLLAKKYGAMFILLPIAGKKLPYHYSQRKKIIQKILDKARSLGFQKEDIIIDALAMTVSCHPDAPLQTLKTIAWCKKELRCQTTIGLSNISFGMPQRHLINASFLKLALEKGLSCVIADPITIKTKPNALACNMLLNKMDSLKEFIAFYAKSKTGKTTKETIKDVSIEKKIFNAILEGDKDTIAELIDQAIHANIEVFKLMRDYMIKAIIEVGQRYQRKEYFLPQLIRSAETMKKGIKKIEPLLTKTEAERSKKPLIFLATVEGDIHDIGKNIVALMLKNHGFEIIDLGKDVPAKKIIGLAIRYKPAIIGLSALMTTTMINMQKVVEAARREKLESKFLLGGAVITKHFADTLGCTYAKDGVEAVYAAQKILKLNNCRISGENPLKND